MPLLKTFQFSATSLQDYVDCARRFQLRYLVQAAWPALRAEPIEEQERHARLARDFHRLVHQHLLGLPATKLSASIHDPKLERWWRAYLAYVPAFGSAQVIPELSLSIPLSGYRLTAQYDAVAVAHPGSIEQDPSGKWGDENGPSLLIVDWKTYLQRPTRTWLAQRLQSRVYPVILVEAGAILVSQARLEPDAVKMCYWLAEYPQDPEIIVYDSATFQTDLEYLSTLIAEIDERIKGSTHGSEPVSAFAMEEIWPLTSDLRQCRFCNYRSLCGRGAHAGPFADHLEDAFYGQETTDAIDLTFDLDWGQVQEIVY